MFGNRQNTPAAGNTTLFGTPTPSQPSAANPSSSGGGVFGVTPSPASTTGSAFGTPSSTPQPGGRLFGTIPSINTTAAGTGGTFFGGSTLTGTNTTSSAPQTGGLFYAPAAVSGVVSTGGPFGTTAPAASTGGPFGTTTPVAGPFGTTASGAGTGGPFGTTTPVAGPFGSTAPVASTGGPFGSTAPSAGTGGLFGSTAPAASTGGPFATTASAASITPSYPSIGGLLGTSTTPTATSAPSTSGGLFRAAPATPTSAGAVGSLLQGLGATSTTQPPPTKPSVFGGTNSAPPKLFTPSSVTAPASTINTQAQGQQATLQSAVKVELNNLAQYHKFHELNDALKAEIEAAERYILSEMQKSEALSAAFPEHREMVHSISNDTELLERRLHTTNSLLQSDSAALENLMKYQKEDDQHASLSVRTLDLLRLSQTSRIIQSQQTTAPSTAQSALSTAGPAQVQPGVDAFPPIPTAYSTTTNELDITSSAGIINYFNRINVDMEARLKQFMESVGEVEASLRSVEVQAARKLASRGVTVDGGATAPGEASSEGREDDARRLIIKTLKAFYETMSDVSVRLVDSQQGLRELKDAVSQGTMGRSIRR